MTQRLLHELRDVAMSLDRNIKRSWYLILAPNALCILGAFTMGFGIMASVLTNNVPGSSVTTANHSDAPPTP